MNIDFGRLGGSPTLTLYGVLQRAYDHFNADLFDGRLSQCLLSLRSSSRVYGYHHHKRFIAPDGTELDELGLHPGFFTVRPVEEVLSTLVHEMVHHWQDSEGTPSPSNPHNREWADRMEALGLVPSSTGLPGGKRTGRSMSHWIDPNGRFLDSCRRLVDTGFRVPWLDRHAPVPVEHAEQRAVALRAAGVALTLSPPPAADLPADTAGEPRLVLPAPKAVTDRVRYMCPRCATKAWAKSETVLLCGVCEEVMPAG